MAVGRVHLGSPFGAGCDLVSTVAPVADVVDESAIRAAFSEDTDP